MIDDLKTLIDFSPVSTDQSAVVELLNYVQDRLIARGLHVTRIENEGIHSLYASTLGKPHSKVLLQGHIDVVPDGQAFRQEGDILFGRGCYDMLFATASYLRLIDELDNPEKYDIGLLLTSDEELGGHRGVGAMMEQPDYSCDICITPDAGEKFGDLSIAAKGIYQMHLKITGRSHHGSRPWEGDGAADKAIRFIEELRRAFDTSDKSNSTMTVSYLDAGLETALNQGPSFAHVGIDIRYRDRSEYERLSTLVGELLQKYDAHIVRQMIDAEFELDIQNPLVGQFIALYEDALDGKDVRLITAHGSSDARFFAMKDMPVIMFRPDGANAHGDEETLSLASWEKFHDLLVRYVTTVSKVVN